MVFRFIKSKSAITEFVSLRAAVIFAGRNYSPMYLLLVMYSKTCFTVTNSVISKENLSLRARSVICSEASRVFLRAMAHPAPEAIFLFQVNPSWYPDAYPMSKSGEDCFASLAMTTDEMHDFSL